MSNDVFRIAGGVASLTTGLLCLEIAESQLQCVELATGTVVSTIPGNGLRPATWIQDKLIVWQPDPIERNLIRPLVADVSSQNATLVSLPPLALPDWVDVRSANADRFLLEALGDDRKAVFQWRARAQYDGGAPPPREVLDASKHAAQGTAVYDIDSKALLSSETAGQNVAPVESTDRTDRGLLDPPAGTYRVPYRKSMSVQSNPWIVDGRAMAVWPHAEDGSPGLSLVYSPAAKAGVTAQQLAKGRVHPANVEVLVSGDGRQVFVGAQEEGADAVLQWQVFEAGGKQLGTIPRKPGTVDIAKVGNQVIAAVDEIEAAPDGKHRRRRLKAMDFASGKLLWSLPIFDRIEHLPPLPPPRSS